MRLIKPFSEELRVLKSKAIIDRDVPLLVQLKHYEGQEFTYCETFFDLMVVSCDENDKTPIVESTALSEVFKSIGEGE